MLEWLSTNKDWIFSGAGIVILTIAMMPLVWKLIKGRKKGQSPVSSPFVKETAGQSLSDSITHGDSFHAKRDLTAAKDNGIAVSFRDSQLNINLPEKKSIDP